MSRPTQIIIDSQALFHNIERVRQLAPGRKIIAMVKANAYGCGLLKVTSLMEHKVDAFGVSCLTEALNIRAQGVKTPSVLFQGVFNPEELHVVAAQQFSCVIHQMQQIEWLVNTPLSKPISVWIKVNTGMNRLGVTRRDVASILNALHQCPWIKPDIGLMTHLACADEPSRIENEQQLQLFSEMQHSGITQSSIANSAAIFAFPKAHADVVRPGLMLYGVSPFADQTATDLGLKPVMHFVSAISAIHPVSPKESVGYGATWSSPRPSVIGIVPVGYGDGYPRHIASNTPVWIEGKEVPIVGRVSMDMLAVDLTDHPKAGIGSPVELWGAHLPVERIADSAGTLGYELLCQITERPRSYQML